MRLVAAVVMAFALSFLSTGLLFYPDGWSELAHAVATTLAIGLSCMVSMVWFVRGTKPVEQTPVAVTPGRHWW